MHRTGAGVRVQKGPRHQRYPGLVTASSIPARCQRRTAGPSVRAHVEPLLPTQQVRPASEGRSTSAGPDSPSERQPALRRCAPAGRAAPLAERPTRTHRLPDQFLEARHAIWTGEQQLTSEVDRHGGPLVWLAVPQQTAAVAALSVGMERRGCARAPMVLGTSSPAHSLSPPGSWSTTE